MARKLYRLGLFTAHHKWIVVAFWIVAVVLLLASFREFGGNTSNNLELPGTDSQAATDLLSARFPPQQNGSNPIVFYTRDGKVTDAANEAGDQAVARGDQGAEARPQRAEPIRQEARLADQQGQADRVHTRPARRRQRRPDRAHRLVGPRRRGTGPPRRDGGGRRRLDRQRALGARDGEQRGGRPDRRDDHPRLHLRHVGGDGDADPLRDLRTRRRPLADRAARQRRDGAVDRTDAGDDDRPRRRDRLRALPRLPLPVRARRGTADRRGDRDRRGDFGHGDRVRGHHGRHRPRDAHRRRDPARHVARLLGGLCGPDRRARRDHAGCRPCSRSPAGTSTRSGCPPSCGRSPSPTARVSGAPGAGSSPGIRGGASRSRWRSCCR